MADAYNNRGVSKDKLGNYKGAIADYDKAIELNPQDGQCISQSWRLQNIN